MNVLKILYMLFLCLLFLAACLPTANANLPTQTPTVPTPMDGGEMQPPVAAVKARRALAQSLNVPESDVRITQIVDAQWSDACLGLPAPDELCAEVITPGFSVLLKVGERTYEYRTDRAGDNVREGAVQ